jgi:anti-sigma factor (TIGR02949 family)
MAEPTPSQCEEALKRLMEYIDGELPDEDHHAVERHLCTCRSCFSRMEFERRLKDRFATIASDSVSIASRERVRQLIKRL